MKRLVMKNPCLIAPLAFAGLVSVQTGLVAQEPSTETLTKSVQNPVASLISVPFQDNANFAIGPYGRIQNILNVQPVIPMELNGSWNLITRIIVPFIFQPQIATPSLGTSGLGDLNPTFFFSPAKAGRIIWGAGPTFSLRTETSSALGNGKWGSGPSIVVLTQPKHWTLGVLANNIWSFAGDQNRRDVNSLLLQYFVNYNLKEGWYLTSQPIVTADWKAPSGQRWVAPFGGGFGRVFRIGNQPINGQVAAYYNSIRPDEAAYPGWSVRFQIALLYPKPK